jgi:hypothetical protein
LCICQAGVCVLFDPLEEIGGGAFNGSSICKIEIESGNGHFIVSGSFLMNFDQTCIIQYFGCDSDVIIPSGVEILLSNSFAFIDCVDNVAFHWDRTLRRCVFNAVDSGSSLTSIYIPASVTFIGSECFTCRHILSEVQFGAGSKLREIEWDAFQHCEQLKSITIPSSVQTLGPSSFCNCSGLRTVVFLSDSELVRLERAVHHFHHFSFHHWLNLLGLIVSVVVNHFQP